MDDITQIRCTNCYYRRRHPDEYPCDICGNQEQHDSFAWRDKGADKRISTCTLELMRQLKLNSYAFPDKIYTNLMATLQTFIEYIGE